MFEALLGLVKAMEIPPPTLTDMWENQGVMPVSRNRGSATAIGNKIYIFGGYDASTVQQGTLHVFDPADKSFTAKTSSTARTFHDSVNIGGKLYVFGGLTNGGTTYANDIVCYDPVANNWQAISTNGVTPTVRARHKMVADSTGFYVIGGITTGGSQVIAVQRFETTTNTWTNVTGNLGAVLYGIADNSGTIYASGGYPSSPLNTFNSMVLATGTVTAKANLPSTRYGHVSFYAKGGVYMCGGVTGIAGEAVIVQRWNPTNNTWGALGTIPFTMVDYSMVCMLNGAAYIFGGNGATGTIAWKYNP